MTRFVNLLLLCMLLAAPVHAEQRIIVRALGGQSTLNSACLLLGCNIVRSLDDPLSEVFLVTIADGIHLGSFMTSLSGMLGIVNVEPDRVGRVLDIRPPIPAYLHDSEQVQYFGVNVRRGYVTQPAVQVIRIAEAQSTFSVAGGAVKVAVIDTGIDPNHPALRSVLLPGYDYIRNYQGTASELGDINQSTAAVVDGVPPTHVSGSAAAVVDQSTAAVVDTPDHAAFGHGTMVAGMVHLVAPQALILPLKAFGSNGSGYTSDVLRAVYRAVREGTHVINMSFSMPAPSVELKRAVDFASNNGAICVASAGNEGKNTAVYPAAWTNVVGVASTNYEDVRSAFSNYGSSLVSLAAPGEAVVTTYPFGTYAAAWGTSFSTPLVSGTIALLRDIKPGLSSSEATSALGRAAPLGPELGSGRLDVYRAVDAARTSN